MSQAIEKIEQFGSNPVKNPCATGCGACPFAVRCHRKPATIISEGSFSKVVVTNDLSNLFNSDERLPEIIYFQKSGSGAGRGVSSTDAKSSVSMCSICKKSDCDCPFSLKNRLN